MGTTQTTPAAAEVAAQFQIEPLEPRLEMLTKYGRDTESPTPSVDPC